jgi:DNA-binding protein H-NS
MADIIQNLSEQELAELIANASKHLESKRHGKRKEVIAEMKALAASIGMEVEITEAGEKGASRKGSKVPVKYRDPDNSRNTWTGRGVKPRWLSAYVGQGRSVDEFRV